MYEKLKKIFILIFIFLLQSCSGGKIGNFLESSFKNIDNSESDNKENYILKNEENRSEKQTLIKKIKKVNNQKSKLVESIEYQKKEDLKNDEKSLNEKINKEENSQQKIKKSLKPPNKKKILRPESYRITVILNEVDPSSPLKQFSNVLINSDLNFEIENIQRYPLNQNLNKNRE